jgi:hypothetical protein
MPDDHELRKKIQDCNRVLRKQGNQSHGNLKSRLCCEEEMLVFLIDHLHYGHMVIWSKFSFPCLTI